MTTFTAADYQLLEPGVYEAVFDRTVDPLEPGPFGHFTIWYFVATTEEGPVEVSGISSRRSRLTRSTKARQWLEDILGRPLINEETIDTSSLRGTRVMLELHIKTTEFGEFNHIVGIRHVAAAKTPVSERDIAANTYAEFAAWLAERGVPPPTVEIANADESPQPSRGAGGPLPDTEA